MGTAIEMYVNSSLPERQNYAYTISQAAMLLPPGLRDGNQGSPGKVMLVMETGAMLGIHPVAAIQGVNIIEGKPTISPGLMSAVVRRAGHKLRVTTEGNLRDETISATATLIRNDDPDYPFVVTWDLTRARHAGLYPGKDRSAWSKYPEAMLKARAISEVCREGATDALMGVGYVPEEMGAEVNEAGEVVLGELRSQPASAPAPQAPATQAATPPVETQQDDDVAQSWKEKADQASTSEEAAQVFYDCRDGGYLGQLVDREVVGGTDGEMEQVQLRTYIGDITKALKRAEDAAATLNQRLAETTAEDGTVEATTEDDDRPMALGGGEPVDAEVAS